MCLYPWYRGWLFRKVFKIFIDPVISIQHLKDLVVLLLELFSLSNMTKELHNAFEFFYYGDEHSQHSTPSVMNIVKTRVTRWTFLTVLTGSYFPKLLIKKPR